MSGFSAYFKSAFTVDNVIFGFDEGNLKVLLIKRGEEPHKDKWALPGYFVRPDEDLDRAAERVLQELTGLVEVYLEQVKTFGGVHRHPFGRVITVAYYSLIKISDYSLQPSSIASSAYWHQVEEKMDLAFDHEEILHSCLHKLKSQVRNQPIGFELLPPKFTLSALQHLYEAILETSLDRRNLRKKILLMDLLIDTGETQSGVAHRPAKLFQFDKDRYTSLKAEGFTFEVRESKKTKG